MPAYRLENPVQRYAWGSRDGITRVLGIPNPGGGPFAEIWMGAHPSAPSVVLLPGGRRRLDDLVREQGAAFVGPDCAERFGGALPFLFKILSAGSPLSIQAHPGKRKAERGFEHENLAGIPLDAPERNYRDPNHKPEMAVALTPFQLLCGFRPTEEIIANVHHVAPREHERILGRLERSPGKVELSVFFYSLIKAGPGRRRSMLRLARSRIERILSAGEAGGSLRGTLEWVVRLMDAFPGDMGALSPLVLNLVALEPGQGVFIAPGELHAHLEGTCLEIMANSDNVVRGGLTGKYMDLPELVSVLSFKAERVLPSLPFPAAPCEEAWPVHVPDFRLSRVAVGPGRRYLRAGRGPEILLCARGAALIEEPGSAPLALGRGESAFVTASSGDYSLVAAEESLVFRASVPERP